MFCPKCGKQVKDEDNFCRYCGAGLQEEEFHDEKVDTDKVEDVVVSHEEETYSVVEDNSEEFVLCDLKKHIMALFWPIVMTPIFFLYFWNIFLNTHSFFSWVVVFLILSPIVYPVLRYNSDKIIVTSKYMRIKVGVINPEEIDIPLSKLDMVDLSQTTVGRMLDYGSLSFNSNGKQFEYGYIKDLGELQYIIENPETFVKESLEEDNQQNAD